MRLHHVPAAERLDTWTWPLNIGQVSTTLQRLERDGLVVREAEQWMTRRPWRLTDQGRAEGRLQQPRLRATRGRASWSPLALVRSYRRTCDLIQRQRAALNTLHDRPDCAGTWT